MRPHVLDLLKSTSALAARSKERIKTWCDRHRTTAPSAALALAHLGIGIANKLAADAQSAIDVARDNVQTLNTRAEVLVELIDVLDHSTLTSLHPILSPTVHTILSSLGVAGQVLVTGTREVSYELWTLSLNRFEQLVSTADSNAIRWPIYVFKVPHPPLDWPLQHALLYHEIGHALFHARGKSFKVSLPPGLDHTKAKDLLERMRIAGDAARFARSVQLWAEEIFADIVGILLVGPAYLLAFCHVLGGNFSIQNCSDTHPPTAFRIQILAESLKTHGLVPEALPPALREVWDGWLSETDASHTTYRPANDNDDRFKRILPVLIESLTAASKPLLASVAAELGDKVCTPARLADDIERAKLMESTGIPPIEQGTVPSLEKAGIPMEAHRVFSISWLAHYMRRADAGDEVQAGQSLLEALDASEALRAWRVPK